MTNKNIFENYSFSETINTIVTENFPQNFPLHWHKYIEIIALPDDCDEDTSATFLIHQKEYVLKPGDIIFIWSGELHEVLDNKEQKIIGIQFPNSVFHELPEFTPYLQHFRNINFISAKENTELAQNLVNYLKHIVSLKYKSGNFRGVETIICLYEFFMELGNHITSLVPSRELFPRRNAQWEKMNQICRYITENCEHPLTLDSVAAEAGFNPYYFCRVFKKVTGSNFVEYLTTQRVKRAQTLLADARLSMTDVAYQSGFRSISTFNRSFHNIKGCSPSQYRKYYLNDF